MNGLGDYCQPDRLAGVDNKHAFVWRDFSFVRPGRLKPTGTWWHSTEGRSSGICASFQSIGEDEPTRPKT
jgi:hypothetical protein